MMVTHTVSMRADMPLDCRLRNIPSLQPAQPPPRPRRRRRLDSLRSGFSTLLLLFALAALPAAHAVFLSFDNCLSSTYRNAHDPKRLQFTPLHVWAAFNTSNAQHHLSITVWGNVSGQAAIGSYPEPESDLWTNPEEDFGKIVNASRNNGEPVYTTLLVDIATLTYSAWSSGPQIFCDFVKNGKCPIGPAFPVHGANASDPSTLPSFGVERDFESSYSFAAWEATMRIISGEVDATTLGCISTTITPALGSALADTLSYLPAAILALVAIATIFAATCSPWGSVNVFQWTGNYGRDKDLLRLVTPGFGDCLQYIQFIVLAGSLTLNYPGFFQPVVSQAAWSVLLFNESLVSRGNGTQSLVDGIYFANGTYGLSRLREYVGVSEDEDVWAGMAVWLLVLILIVSFLVQLGFFIRWMYNHITGEQDVGMREKNWPFTAGNIIRIVFNYFMLPIITLSFFQLVVAPRSSASVVAAAVVLLIGVAGVAIWIFWSIFTTRPRAHLFDDLPTALTYGPLYNTYSDDAAPFAFIPVLLTVIRGVAIGAIQPSGIAQIIVLVICEVILILTLRAFRPFQSNTSMNAYHTFFSAIRLISTLLMVAFVPTLGVSEATKGWIGYTILLLHAIVLVVGFFLNSLQTIIEVTARLTGAGADQRGGLTKVFGKRQLAKRNHRHQRSSLNSNAAMLAHDGNLGSIQLLNGGRTRSLSGSSAILLNQQYNAGSHRGSVGFDQFSGESSQGGRNSPGTPGNNAAPYSFLSGSGPSSRRHTMGTTLENPDPYYRPPRPRKQTMDPLAPVVPGGASGSAEPTSTPYADNPDQAEFTDVGEGPSSSSPNRSMTPAFLRTHRDDSDPNLERRNKTDYSVRESDFYYGLRGPALSTQPSRKLKTGPADPMGPVSSATGWFKSLGLFNGKSKEKGKGFEVVRSTRMAPQMMIAEEDEAGPALAQERYRDSPDMPTRGRKSLQQGSPTTGARVGAGSTRQQSERDLDISDRSLDHDTHNRVSSLAPSLGPIDSRAGIELPSRIGSLASNASRGQVSNATPAIPRRSSRRTRSTGQQHLHPNPGGLPIRLPFGSTEPSPSPEHSPASSLFHNAVLNIPTTGAVPPSGVQTHDRAMSTGYVHQYMTGDNIQNGGYDAGRLLEASAEIVDRTRTMSTSRSGGSYESR